MYTVYSKPMCPQCDVAINKLKSKGLTFQVKKLGEDYELEDLFAEIEQSSTPSFNPKSFPVVFLDNEIVTV
jgi:glutaredoxin